MAGWMFLSMDDLITGSLDRWQDHKMAGWMDISMDYLMAGARRIMKWANSRGGGGEKWGKLCDKISTG